ncbi:ATP-dependent DNA helicase PIF1 [Phytophthora ramorum]|uniref:ATP-dependent DNA helicase PIF1 n=1 Tax=Phytophthora ramorum TaxID=164328 RepID=UPI0030A76918|nr:ATP-dependent DNA helicase PIF1 [Phytophthora ramorum]
MYDYLATERVKKGVFVRVRHDPNTATRAMHVSAEELRGAMEARVVMRRAARTEKPVTSCEGRNCANSVLKAINASTAKMWGSNEERDSFQRKVNAMTFMYGKPSVFWTLTPYSEGSIAVAFWSGYDLPYKRPTDLAACTVVNLPSTASMKRLTMQNTMLQARYFEMCCKILIEIMFGWDSTVSKPKLEPGIFGFVEAFFYALEQQGRLRVHIHGVMWVAGLPKTKTDWEKLLADSTMRARFESYCASILCKQQLTDANVAALVIERKWNELDAEHKAVSTENTACTLRLRFGGLSAHEPTASAQLSRLLQHDQQYYVALDEASEFRAQPTTDSEDSTCDDPDVLDSHFERASGAAAARSENLLAVGSDVYTAVTNPINITDEEAALLQNAAEESAVKRLLSNKVELTDLPADQISDVFVRSVPVRMSELETFEQQLAAKHPPERSSTNNNDFVQTTEITVELLNAAVADLTIAETNSLSIDNLTPFASVQSVSSAFNLNKEQHLAFLHVAVPLLYRIADIKMLPQSTFCGDPLIITGAGGTGKTRIVDALRCLACNWGRPKCIMATASSGIAAANLKGHTIHSAVNLGINQKCLPRHIQNPGDKLRTKWDPVLCVVADEMSMTDVGFFGLWEEALQKVKDCRQPFGGLLGVFMFDFFQLLTVRGIPAFRVADSQKPYSEIQARGSLLYRSVNKVVYLTQNMRFASDPE